VKKRERTSIYKAEVRETEKKKGKKSRRGRREE
jgi:hypothetical protein